MIYQQCTNDNNIMSNNDKGPCLAKSHFWVVFQDFLIFRKLQRASIKCFLRIQIWAIHHKVIRR